MRRKSDRKSKTSPEKKTTELPTRRSHRRRRQKSASSSPERDDEQEVQGSQETEEITSTPTANKQETSNSNSEEEKTEEKLMWQVKSAETPPGSEIQKLKICLQRPSSTPERNERSPRRHKKHRGGASLSQTDEDSCEETAKSRSSRKHKHHEDIVESSSEEKGKKMKLVEEHNSSDSQQVSSTDIDENSKQNEKEEVPGELDEEVCTTDGQPELPDNQIQNGPESTVPEDADTSTENAGVDTDATTKESSEAIEVIEITEIVDQESEQQKENEDSENEQEVSFKLVVEEDDEEESKEIQEVSETAPEALEQVEIIEVASVDLTNAAIENTEAVNEIEIAKDNVVIVEAEKEVIEKSEANESVVESNEQATESNENVTESSENVAESSENVAESNEDVVGSSSENAVESSGHTESNENGAESNEHEVIENTTVESPDKSVEENDAVDDRSRQSSTPEREPKHDDKKNDDEERRTPESDDCNGKDRQENSHTPEIPKEVNESSEDDRSPVRSSVVSVVNQVPAQMETTEMDDQPVYVADPSRKKLKLKEVVLDYFQKNGTRVTSETVRELCPDVKVLSLDEIRLDDDIRASLDSDEIIRKIKKKPFEDKKITIQQVVKETVLPTPAPNPMLANRKISIVGDDSAVLHRPPSPAKNEPSPILYIKNLVRPFTLTHLKELLSRTGRIKEGGFWINNIKSECYVHYESLDESVNTRNALHGVHWPVANGRKLDVDFGTVEAMEKARQSTDVKIEKKTELPAPEAKPKEEAVDWREERERERLRREQRGIREWDLGKQGHDRSPTPPPKRRHSISSRPSSQDRKIRKKEDVPSKLLDDLFRKTKTTPCIYWLPLSAEMIVIKEEQRRKHMAEHERRLAELRRVERMRRAPGRGGGRDGRSRYD